ncbi:MAG: DNA repair protein RadC [Nevskia sp.]|nr:DNA repair protein RadC [Nevskia sp.]
MSIRDWPEGERPREKLLQRGPQALSDAELLAIFLRTGVAGKSAVDLARELVARFGGLRGLLRADEAQFCAAKGLGQAKFVQLQAVLEIARRHLAETLDQPAGLRDPGQARSYLRARLRDLDHEVFAALFLDTQHRVLGFEVLARGTLNAASVYPREVVKAALRHNAGALIFAHNHPSGVAEPSEADRSLTRRLKDALALVDIRTLDHFVVGEGEPVSFAERGWL